ncbi:MAG: 6-bladed beta-propeller [Bacteroidaceae bacterium]
MKISTFIVLMISLSSCVSDKTIESSSKYVTMVKPTTTEEEIPFDSIVESYRYVQLETSPKCLIGEVEQLLLEDDRIYVVSNGVYCFNKAGKFLFSVDKKGRGPGEFVTINSVSLSNGRLYIHDCGERKVLSFNSKTGVFAGEKAIPYPVPRLYVADSTYIVDRSEFTSTLVKNDERFYICNQDSPEKAAEAFFPEKKDKILILGQLTTCDGGKFYTDYYNNKAYKITKMGVEPYFELSIEKGRSLTDKEKELLIKDRQISNTSIRDKKRIFGMTHTLECKDFIFAQYSYGDQPAYIFFDKSTKKERIFEYTKSKGHQWPPVDVSASQGDYFCSIISAGNVALKKSLIEVGEDLPANDPEYNEQSIYKNNKPEDNPIVVFYKLKHIK